MFILLLNIKWLNIYILLHLFRMSLNIIDSLIDIVRVILFHRMIQLWWLLLFFGNLLFILFFILLLYGFINLKSGIGLINIIFYLKFIRLCYWDIRLGYLILLLSIEFIINLIFRSILLLLFISCILNIDRVIIIKIFIYLFLSLLA